MSAAGAWQSVAAPGGAIRVLTLAPATPPPWPGLMLIHAVLGIDAHLESLAAEFAASGYFTAVPDLYTNDSGYRQHRPEDIEIAAHFGRDAAKLAAALAGHPLAERQAIQAARQWMDRRASHLYIDLVHAAFDWLRGSSDIRATGALGFCMGGRLVGELAATGADLEAGVIHYGAPPDLASVPQIRCELEGHYASRDPGITQRVPAFAAAMKAAGKAFTSYIYEADHGFSLAPGGPSHDAASAQLAMARSKAFLAAALKPAMGAA